MKPLTIYGFAPSTYTRTARMGAAEKGVAHVLKPVPFGQPGHFALHPFARLPILQHDAHTVYEALAILAYLDEAFDGDALIPANAADRRRTLQAVSVALDYAYDELVRHSPGDDAPGADAENLARVLDWLDERAGEAEWLSGGAPGAADLFFAPMFDYHRAQAGAAGIDRRPALGAWFGRVSSRPSFGETVAG